MYEAGQGCVTYTLICASGISPNGRGTSRAHFTFLIGFRSATLLLAGYMVIQPLYDRLHEELLKQHIIQIDETPCHVTKDGRPANANSYMFVYHSGEYHKDGHVVLYDYRKTRNSSHMDEFLGSFSGTIMSDAFSGYDALDRKRADIRIAHCWAHARRDYAMAVKIQQGQNRGPSKQSASSNLLRIKHCSALVHFMRWKKNGRIFPLKNA